jgi:hypothetical protein
MSAGAHFVRADLHVHSQPDSGEATLFTPRQYVESAWSGSWR